MRRYTQPYIRGNPGPRGIEDTRHLLHIRVEALLPRLQRPVAESGPAIERGQQRDGDAGAARGVEMALQHFGGMVEIVELGDAGIPLLQHLDIQLKRDRLRLLGRNALYEA